MTRLNCTYLCICMYMCVAVDVYCRYICKWYCTTVHATVHTTVHANRVSELTLSWWQGLHWGFLALLYGGVM